MPLTPGAGDPDVPLQVGDIVLLPDGREGDPVGFVVVRRLDELSPVILWSDGDG